MMTADFILASGSPRRAELLKGLGIAPKNIVAPAIDETPLKGEAPFSYAMRMAKAKAAAVATTYPQENVLAADTVVAMGRRIMPKTDDKDKARPTLQHLSGRRHRVYTAVCLVTKDGKESTRKTTTVVKVKPLLPHEIEDYLASGEWQGKAGAYAIQGRAAAFITYVGGSYSGVVGLPLYETTNLLKGASLLCPLPQK